MHLPGHCIQSIFIVDVTFHSLQSSHFIVTPYLVLSVFDCCSALQFFYFSALFFIISFPFAFAIAARFTILNRSDIRLGFSLSMAMQPVHRLPLVHISQCPNPSLRLKTPHTEAFAAVLREIPAAAEAMRRVRSLSASLPRTVFILDWDDTCCATSHLERCGVMADLDIRLDQCAPQLDRFLRVLEHRVLSLLKAAVKLGTVLIVTNAGDGWVELSSSRFLPAVRAFLDANYNNIKIISARARYIDAYRHFPLQWKALTFSDVLQTILAENPCNPHDLHVVVLGDSVGDQYAAHVAAEALANAGMPIVLKVVKFLERPTIDQLCKELAVLLDHLLVMTKHRGSFDVSMYKETTPINQYHPQPTGASVHHASAIPSQSHVEQTRTVPPIPTPNVPPSMAVDAQHPVATPLPRVATCAAAV